MKIQSRTRNAKLNILFGYLAQVGILLLAFVGRKIFLVFLSADYLGINGLYSNILTLLSLPELGLDTAVVYSLYKPVANDDEVMISSLLKFFKRIYFGLALLILLIGIGLTPLLNSLIDSNLPFKDLCLYYWLFLLNSTASYFVAHKVALLSASQQQRIQKIVMLSANFILQVTYIVVLVIWQNYYVYLIAMVCTTFLTNVVLGAVCEKMYPSIFKCRKTVDFSKKEILERVGSTLLYKLGAVLINSTDNILISVLVSTVAVGYYSNYYTVVSGVQGFIAIITTSMIAGIGNFAAKDNKEGQAPLFDMMLLFYHMIGALGLVGFSLLFNNFISLWLGTEYTFNFPTVLIIAVNFYLTTAISPVWMFREANGLFNEVKFILLARAVINIVLSVALGKFWGVFGIFLATAVSLIMTNIWIEPRILSRKVLQRGQKVYWLKQLKYLILTLIAFVCSHVATHNISNSFAGFCIKTIMVVLITITCFIVPNLKSKELKMLKKYVM